MIQEFEEDQVKGLTGPELSIKKADLLSIFIEQSALASGTSELNQSDPSLSSVKLMTLHSSKGLEFPVAFLVGMEEGLFPSVKAWEEAPEEDIAEERRLCYVGMTRAREVLYLTGAVIRRIWGNVSYQEPSRFFSEIPDELIEYRDFSVGIRVTEYRIGSSRSLGFGRASDLTSSKVSLTNSPNVSGSKSDWVGRSLHHPDYGKGTVVASEGLGQDQKVTIQFLDRQQKKFLLRYIESYFLGNQL